MLVRYLLLTVILACSGDKKPATPKPGTGTTLPVNDQLKLRLDALEARPKGADAALLAQLRDQVLTLSKTNPSQDFTEIQKQLDAIEKSPLFDDAALTKLKSDLGVATNDEKIAELLTKVENLEKTVQNLQKLNLQLNSEATEETDESTDGAPIVHAYLQHITNNQDDKSPLGLAIVFADKDNVSDVGLKYLTTTLQLPDDDFKEDFDIKSPEIKLKFSHSDKDYCTEKFQLGKDNFVPKDKQEDTNTITSKRKQLTVKECSQ